MEYNKYVDISKAYLYAQIQKDKDDKKILGHRDYMLPFVTISREAGAGGTTISQGLVDYLTNTDQTSGCPWTLFDKNLIQKVVKDFELSGIESILPEGKFSEIQAVFEELFGLHPSKRELVHNIRKSIRKLATMGNAVIVGRGGAIITRNFINGFHVRFVGSKEKRIKHMMDAYGLKRKSAEDFVEREDKERAEYVKKLFGVNITDCHLYDMVINTDHLPYEDVIKMIAGEVFRLREMINQ
ncbi:MAG: cytidylate kinase-like family protein [Chlorobi bacterium]|nr:cytidylate kinase-like family protein [Chlorobiota bacterium]